MAEPAATEIRLRRAADEQRAERDNTGELAEAETLLESQAAVAAGLAEAEAPRESPGAGAVGGMDLVPIGALGGSMTMRSLIRSRLYLRDSEQNRPLLVRWAPPTRAWGPKLQNLRCRRPPSPTSCVAPRRTLTGGTRPRRLATPRPHPLRPPRSRRLLLFSCPDSPVRDVRLVPGADGSAEGPGGSVVVTQELDDGRLVELQFVPSAGSDAVVGGVFQERNEFLGRIQPAGWAMAVRDVPGGVAVLSGPLTEPELGELLDRALGLR